MNYAVIIPLRSLENQPYLKDLLQALKEQSLPPAEVHLVVGDRRQGRAINFGVSKSESPWVATLDDDSVIDDSKLFEKLLKAMQENPEIGMGGAACEVPDWASNFQKKAMYEIPRRFFPRSPSHQESDMVQHPCLVMPKALFEEIGGEDEELIRGLDPVLRKKVRDAGKKVVVIADTWVYHLVPNSWTSILRMYYRNGRGSGYAQRYYPERVLELTDGYDQGEFVEKRSFAFRLSRRILGLFRAIFSLKWIVLSTDLAYGCGVMRERFFPSKQASVPQVVKVDSREEGEYPFSLHIHQIELAS